MPIVKKIKGDLFDPSNGLKFVAHGCNSQGVMGSGVAKIVREKLPSAYNKYLSDINIHGKGDSSLGMCFPARIGNKDPLNHLSICYNLITQHLYGYDGKRFVNYAAVGEAFRDMQQYHIKLHNQLIDIEANYPPIGIPLIGAGLGGGDWGIIEQIINDATPHIDIHLYEV